MKVTKEILIEDLVKEYPVCVSFLREKGIRCLACGEPIWGTLEEAAQSKGFASEEIQQIVDELNERLN
jgi:methionine synthase II (cobalamin-independent)